MGDLKRPERRRWEESTRLLALQIAAAVDQNAAEVRRRLSSEHGLDVPTSTIHNWMKAPGGSEIPSITELSERVRRLLLQEIRRLEMTSAARRDLDRLSKTAQILKALDALKTTSPKTTKRRTLADLNGSEPTNAEPVANAGFGSTASIPGSDQGEI